MRILYLCSGRSFSSGHLNRKLTEVAQCWREAGHDVKHVLGGDILGSPSPYAAKYGRQQTYAPWYKRARGLQPLVTSTSEWRDIRHDRLMLAHLQMISTAWRPDIVWERSCRLHCAGLLFAQRLGVPYVLEWKDHLVNYRFSLFRRKALRMEALKNREADRIVVEAGVLRDVLASEGVDPAKIIVAHNAVRADEFSKDEDSRARVRRELGADDETVLVGYLGSYAFYHDAARLVLAANIIGNSHIAVKARILMVGAGEQYSASRRLAEEMGLLDDILIMKPGVSQDEVPGILSALDIAVLPGSTDIICPIKVQEYMAAELATVAPDYECTREVIRDGQSGMLFRPKDEKALADAIISLAEDANLRARLGQRARDEVVRRFGWESTWGAALESVLHQVGSSNAKCGTVPAHVAPPQRGHALR